MPSPKHRFYRNLTKEESMALVAAINKHSEAIDADLAEVGIRIRDVAVPEMVAHPTLRLSFNVEGLERGLSDAPAESGRRIVEAVKAYEDESGPLD